jgi:hypothetical protein
MVVPAAAAKTWVQRRGCNARTDITNRATAFTCFAADLRGLGMTSLSRAPVVRLPQLGLHLILRIGSPG